MPLKKTFFKLIVLTIAITAAFFLVKYAGEMRVEKNDVRLNLRAIRQTENQSFYFIGSSRTQLAVNPTILKNYFPGTDIYNYGISSSNFMGSCVMAEWVLETQKPDILFIEIGRIKDNLPDGLFKVAEESDLNLFEASNNLLADERSSEKYRIQLRILNDFLLDKISLQEYFKKIIDPKSASFYRRIGWLESEERNAQTTSAFMKYEDLSSEIKQQSVPVIYQNFIINLSKIATKKNVKIVFYLSPLMEQTVEKKLLISIFNSLPNDQKISYPKELIQGINHLIYLKDDYHLNSSGGEKFTNSICPLICDYITKYGVSDSLICAYAGMGSE